MGNRATDRSQTMHGNELVRDTGKNRPAPAGFDCVVISWRVKNLDQAAKAVEQSRQKHLNQIRQALEFGTYWIPAKDIARKLIDANWS